MRCIRLTTRRIHARVRHGKLLHLGSVGCFDIPGIWNYCGPTRGWWVCPTARGHYGWSTWVPTSMPTCVLLEHWYVSSYTSWREISSWEILSMYWLMAQAQHVFFYDKQSCRGLKQDATETLRAHMAEVVLEWISHSAHFVVILLPLVEGWWRATATLDRHHQRSRTEYPYHPCPTWFLVSQTPCHCLWVVPHPVLPRWNKLRKGVATPPGCPPHSWEGDPPSHAPQRMAQGIHCCPLPIEVAWILMGTPWWARLRAPITTEESGREKSIWCPHTLCGGSMYRAG